MRQRAFSLTEILIAVIVVAIVGGALVSAFFSFSLSYSHTEDYTTAREEIENALGALSSQLSNAGLGMPNNRDDKGSFAVAFAKGDSITVAPVMSLMGKKGEAWGGPITVATHDLPDGAVKTLDSGYYAGPELYYAWAVPRSGLVSPDFGKAMRKPSGLSTFENYEVLSEDRGYWSGDSLQLKMIRGATGATAIANAGEWVVFPSFGAPLWVKQSMPSHTTVLVAPGAHKEKVLLGGLLYGLEEAHCVRAARLRVVSGELIQELYETPPQDRPNRVKVLARNIVGAWFRFNPKNRILSVSLAAKGLNTTEARHASGRRPRGWPIGAPDIVDGRNHRILVESMTWRIRN